MSVVTFSITIEHNSMDLTVMYDDTSDLPSLAIQFAEEHSIDEARDSNCYSRGCFVAHLLTSMENSLFPFPPFFPSDLETLASNGINPLSVPSAVCSIVTTSSLDGERDLIRRIQRATFCLSFFPPVAQQDDNPHDEGDRQTACNSLLSELCQRELEGLAADGPAADESNADDDLFFLTTRPLEDDLIGSYFSDRFYNGSAVIRASLKRSDIDEGYNRCFPRIICMVPARAGSGESQRERRAFVSEMGA